jgi:hypothetical protein
MSSGKGNGSGTREDAVPSQESGFIDQLGDLSGSESAQEMNGSQEAKDRKDLKLRGNTEELNVVAAYKAHFREDPVAFLTEVWNMGSGSGWRGYTNYIGAPILIPGQSEAAIRDVLNSEAVKARISALADRRVENLLSTIPPPNGVDAKEVEEKRRKLDAFKQKKKEEVASQLFEVAQKLTEKSVARLDSLSFIKGFAGVANNVLARMYHQGIHINASQIIELRRVASFCAEKKYSIVFLPCHKVS